MIQKLLNRLGKYRHYFKERIRYAFFSPELDGKAERVIEGISCAELLKIFERRISVLTREQKKDSLVRELEDCCPGSLRSISQMADDILDGKIRLFGEAIDLGNEFSWSRDFQSSRTWPTLFFLKMRHIDPGDDSDIKIPWELGRLHHLVTLGQAYQITKDTKYVSAFVRHLTSWIEGNPPGFGIHWSCSMEIAVRVVNLVWAYSFFQDAPEFNRNVRTKVIQLLHACGIHIARNLENRGAARGNHYLSNLLGLLYLGVLFDTKEANQWRELSLRELRTEIIFQVNEDGGSFEGSIPYHRLVAEILLHSAIVASTFKTTEDDTVIPFLSQEDGEKNGLGHEFMARLEKMFEFTVHYLRADGKAPQIGDNDDGRLLILDPLAAGDDHRHLLAVAGDLFKRSDFAAAATSEIVDQIWMFGRRMVEPGAEKSIPGSREYPATGIWILRDKDDSLVLRYAGPATGGKGSHSHNDAFAFDLSVGGIPCIVDPGTYSYSRDRDLRDLFRSGGMHSTLTLDGQEQNLFLEGDPFSVYPNCSLGSYEWTVSEQAASFEGCITYSKAGSSLLHRRRIDYQRDVRRWIITDDIGGEGIHHALWSMPLGPEIKAHNEDQGIILQRAGKPIIVLYWDGPENIRSECVRIPYSPSYNTLMNTTALRFHFEGSIPVRIIFTLEAC